MRRTWPRFAGHVDEADWPRMKSEMLIPSGAVKVASLGDELSLAESDEMCGGAQNAVLRSLDLMLYHHKDLG